MGILAYFPDGRVGASLVCPFVFIETDRGRQIGRHEIMSLPNM